MPNRALAKPTFVLSAPPGSLLKLNVPLKADRCCAGPRCVFDEEASFDVVGFRTLVMLPGRSP